MTANLNHLSPLQGYFLKISRSSDDEKQTEGEEEGQEARAEGGVEVDEKRQVISGVVVLKLSVFALL